MIGGEKTYPNRENPSLAGFAPSRISFQGKGSAVWGGAGPTN